jgi:hypothetical protein
MGLNKNVLRGKITEKMSLFKEENILVYNKQNQILSQLLENCRQGDEL